MIIFYSKITGIHGINGEVETAFKDKSHFASLPILSKNIPIIINDKEYIILKVKKKNKSFVFQLKDIENIDSAKELIGCDIYIDSKYLPELDNDTFYEAELIGYKIIDENKNILYSKNSFSSFDEKIANEIKKDIENIIK